MLHTVINNKEVLASSGTIRKELTPLGMRTRSSSITCNGVPGVTATWSRVIMKTLNRVSPRIDPCGRPVSVGYSLQLDPWSATTMVLFER